MLSKSTKILIAAGLLLLLSSSLLCLRLLAMIN